MLVSIAVQGDDLAVRRYLPSMVCVPRGGDRCTPKAVEVSEARVGNWRQYSLKDIKDTVEAYRVGRLVPDTQAA